MCVDINHHYIASDLFVRFRRLLIGMNNFGVNCDRLHDHLAILAESLDPWRDVYLYLALIASFGSSCHRHLHLCPLLDELLTTHFLSRPTNTLPLDPDGLTIALKRGAYGAEALGEGLQQLRRLCWVFKVLTLCSTRCQCLVFLCCYQGVQCRRN